VVAVPSLIRKKKKENKRGIFAAMGQGGDSSSLPVGRIDQFCGWWMGGERGIEKKGLYGSALNVCILWGVKEKVRQSRRRRCAGRGEEKGDVFRAKEGINARKKNKLNVGEWVGELFVIILAKRGRRKEVTLEIRSRTRRRVRGKRGIRRFLFR